MIKVRVINMSGAEMIVEVNPTWKCDKLKLSLEPLLDSGVSQTDGASAVDPAKNSLMYKLLHVRTGVTLAEEVTLQQQGVKNNDELLLLKRRLNIPQIETDKQRDDRKVADASSIRRATEHLPKKHHDSPQEDAVPNLDFQSELKMILISLIEASERILHLNPEAAKILKQAEDIYLLKEVPMRRTKLEESSVKQLTDMGFPENRARKALLLNQQSVMSAMEWLLSNESNPNIDKQLPGSFDSDSDDHDDDNDTGAEGSGDNDGKAGEAPSTATDPAASSNKTTAAEDGAVGGPEPSRFRSILQTIRHFQQKEFRPNRRALYNLVEMGFSEKDAADALRISGNKENAACEWLLSDRTEVPMTEVDRGLQENSPIYRAILSHPAVQLGLNSPRCFLAFLQMLFNPVKAGHWLNDPEIGPLLMQISRIYHSENLTPSGLGLKEHSLS